MQFIRQYYYLPLFLLAVLVLLAPQVTFAGSLIGGVVSGALYSLVVGITGLFLGVGGMLLDFGINTFVIGFGEIFLNSGVGLAIDNIWVIIRDFINLFFIFGLVYIGFKMILNSDDSNTRRWLVRLILAALLVNFSLFITKLVVDVSNQLATEIAVAGFKEDTSPDSFLVSGYEVALAGDLMDRLGITSIFDWQNSDNIPDGAGPSIGYIFGTGILFLVAAFVFAAAGIMLMIRFVALCFYIVMSPFMFIGWVLPPLENLTQRYWKGFLGRAFFAPILFVFLYLSLRVIDGLQQSGLVNKYSALGVENAKLGEGINGNFEAAQSTLPFFFLTCMFLIGSLIAASKLGANGADTAVSMGKGLANRAQTRVKNAGMNTARFAAAQTGGRLARGASASAGRVTQRGLNRLQQIEGSGRIASATRRVARMNGVQEVVSGAAASMQNTRFGLSRTIEQDTQMRNQTDERANRGMAINNRNTSVITEASSAAEIAARQEDRRRLRTEVGDMSTQEILDRVRTNPKESLNSEYASLLSETQATAIRESGILTTEQIQKFDANRDEGTFKEINATLENSNASTENLSEAMDELNRVMSKMSDERLQGMSTSLLQNQNIASRLTDDQLKGMKGSGRIDASTLKNISDAKNLGLTKIATDGSLANKTSEGGRNRDFQDKQLRGMFRDSKSAGKLPPNILASARVAEYLNPKIVEEFLGNNPKSEDITSVKKSIELYIESGLAPVNTAASWQKWSNDTFLGKQFGL